MQTQTSRDVTARFYKAIGELIARGVIRGKHTFTKKYNINYWNFYATEQAQGTQNTVQLDWLSYIVRDFNISAHWLLTGEGNMFTKEPLSSQTKAQRVKQ